MPGFDDLTREIETAPDGPEICVFFDVDRTLIAGFSAVEYFTEWLLSGRIAPRQVAATVANSAAFQFGRQSFSGLLSATGALLAGIPEEVMIAEGERLFEKRLAPQVYPEARAIVSAHQRKGHSVAILSSATDYQVSALARDLGIENVICNHLEVVDGRLTGRIVRPPVYGTGKLEAARHFAERMGADLAKGWFYSDGFEDVPLLESVGHPRPLNPDRKLARVSRRRGWPARDFDSRGENTLPGLARSGLVAGSLLPSLAAGLPISVARRNKRAGLNLTSSLWGELGAMLAGIDLDVRGEENLADRPAVIIFNHQSNADAIILLKLLGGDLTAVAKKELRWFPLIGPVFMYADIVFIDRADREKSIETLREAVDVLDQGLSIAVAPEGTRSPTRRLGEFKKGAFRLAMAGRAPILPIVIHNSSDVLPKGTAIMHPATVRVDVLPVVRTDDWTVENLDERIAAIRQTYLDVLGGESRS